jgi:hypothetical protein
MSDRLQMSLLISLTVLGLASLSGIVLMEMSGHQTVGVLSAIAGAAVVALTGLMSRWGESLKPLSSQINKISKDLAGNTETTNKIAEDVNGNTQALRQEITDLKAKLAEKETGI